MLKYSNLDTGKQHSQIMMAGSHDVGLTEGGGNTSESGPWQAVTAA